MFPKISFNSREKDSPDDQYQGPKGLEALLRSKRGFKNPPARSKFLAVYYGR
jgi:hypothetical protein